jgi:hypothetical protein
MTNWKARSLELETQLQSLRGEVRRVVEPALQKLYAVQHATFGLQAGDEPDVYADYDSLCAFARDMDASVKALASLHASLGEGFSSSSGNHIGAVRAGADAPSNVVTPSDGSASE